MTDRSIGSCIINYHIEIAQQIHDSWENISIYFEEIVETNQKMNRNTWIWPNSISVDLALGWLLN